MTITDTKPEVEYDRGTMERRYGFVSDAFRHEDGAITYIVPDMDGEHANPREYDGNISVLIQENDRLLDIDEDDAGLKEARERFDRYGRHGTSAYKDPKTGWRVDREAMMERYITIFRPDILHYADWISLGREGYGWGYVTKATWDEHMYRKPPENATDEEKLAWVEEEPSCTPEEAFKSEVDVYGQWADGEVYGVVHVSVGKPIVVLGEHGAYVEGYEEDEDSCWGFLGYDDHKDMADQFTDSPITEVLY